MSDRDRTDPIALQLLWTRLEAIAEEGVLAIQRTAISPAVAEAKDCTCTIVDANGGLLVGGGALGFHFGAACTAVRSILALHGPTVAPGDVFFGNDPHSDIAIHNQDVMVAQPVFADGVLVAWMVASAHMIDMGGLQFGSFSPLATECFQEAIRLPPVRLYRAGEEQRDIWAVLRNNIRVPDLVEMDLRALIAGCHVAGEKLVALVDELGGTARFLHLAGGMDGLLDAELDRRFRQLTPGRYRATAWSEWETELYALPCELTVADGRLRFDFTGVPPQCSHYINSKPWIVKANLVPHIQNLMAIDLPFANAIYGRVDVVCPEGTILNCTPPAPNAASHMDVGGNAAAVALSTLVLALAASENAPARDHLAGVMPLCNHCMQTWSFTDRRGRPDGFLVIDGSSMGGPGTMAHDGTDFTFFVYGRHAPLELIATEVYEEWYPMLVTEKRFRPGAAGAGRFRSGTGVEMGFRPHGADKLTGLMIATREHMPTGGMAGGFPGALTEIAILRPDGAADHVSAQASHVEIRAGEEFHFRMSSAGGYGDPLTRDPSAVLEDMLSDRLNAAEAASAYGVVLDGRAVDEGATRELRGAMLKERLATARPARRPLPATGPATRPANTETAFPLYPGVVQRARFAVSEHSGAVLAEAPHPWTDGCPTIEARRMSRAGIELAVVTYLDPITGHALAVDSRVADGDISFMSLPDRWARSA